MWLSAHPTAGLSSKAAGPVLISSPVQGRADGFLFQHRSGKGKCTVLPGRSRGSKCSKFSQTQESTRRKNHGVGFRWFTAKTNNGSSGALLSTSKVKLQKMKGKSPTPSVLQRDESQTGWRRHTSCRSSTCWAGGQALENRLLTSLHKVRRLEPATAHLHS